MNEFGPMEIATLVGAFGGLDLSRQIAAEQVQALGKLGLVDLATGALTEDGKTLAAFVNTAAEAGLRMIRRARRVDETEIETT